MVVDPHDHQAGLGAIVLPREDHTSHCLAGKRSKFKM